MVRHVVLKRPRPSNHVNVQLLASEGSLQITCGLRLLASNRSQLSPITSPSPSRPALESVGTLDRYSCWLIFDLLLPSGLVAWSNVSIHLLALNLVRQPRPTKVMLLAYLSDRELPKDRHWRPFFCISNTNPHARAVPQA